ncbi:MAG: choice-of-anchor M domain-containing protein [Verrucomicrobiota bacterium]
MKATKLLLFSGLLTATSSATSVITSGHADYFSIGYEEESPGVFVFEPHVHVEEGVVDGVPIDLVANPDGLEFEPDEIIIQVSNTTFDYTTSIGGRPAGTAWDPLGVPATSSYWYLPSGPGGPGGAGALGTIYGGLGAEELEAADWSTITVTLESVVGPGDFSMWTEDIGGPTFLWASADGIDGSDVATVDPGDHTDNFLGFTAAGIYEITVNFSGTHTPDGPFSESATYTFQVPEPSVGLLGLGAVALLARRRRQA